MALAERGARVLVFEWTLSEAVAPWFGLPPAGIEPREVLPRVSVANFQLDDALRAFFVGHLGMGTFYRHVVHGRAVHRLVEAAPGIAEMMFLGHVCWLTTLASKEAGLSFDHVLVDAPATGHGTSLLDLPATLSSMHASGLLGSEMVRVEEMMRDPGWTGAIAVALPEELPVEETMELVPRATRSLGRQLLGVVVNRSVTGLVTDGESPAWLEALRTRMPAAVTSGLETIHADLLGRRRFEERLRRGLDGATRDGLFAMGEQLALGPDLSPRGVVTTLARSLRATLRAPP
jgi:anion-transporting  ArsA/GET3 family ATPase